MKKTSRSRRTEAKVRDSKKQVPFKVFFSHKEKDERDFRAIATQLELAYGSRIQVFIAERMAGRTKWFDKIMEEICHCDHFVLIYTNPSLGWDFPIFESGVRTGWEMNKSLKSVPKVTVIHHEKAICPSPLSHWQAIEASSQNTTRLDGFLLEIHRQITKKRFDGLEEVGKPFIPLKTVQSTIIRLLEEGLLDSHSPLPEIRVRLPSLEETAGSPSINSMPVELNATMAILLGVRQRTYKWRRFTQGIESKCSFSERWIECMLDAIKRSASDTEIAYPLPLIRLRRDKTIFELRPNLNAIRQNRESEVEAIISFSLRPSTSTEEGDGRLHKVMEFLNGTKRIRATALPSFIHQVDQLQRQPIIRLEDVRKIAYCTYIVLVSIIEEAYGAGYDRDDIVREIKGEGETQQTVNQMFEEWDLKMNEFKAAGRSLSDDESCELLNQLVSAAKELEGLNLQFAKRASKAVAKYFEADVPVAPTPSRSLMQKLGFPFWSK